MAKFSLAHALIHPAGKLAGMYSHLWRRLPGETPCWHCTAWGGYAYGGPHSFCTRADSSRVQAAPATGCAFFVREVGADDEPGPPALNARAPSAVQAYRPPVAPVQWAP